ncbi:MAG: GNAT family N-acetyltransferase [Actinobacteria bacterium]|nr:MAG: GNAT family N-acetyltransferase [Actinomycetota bacterium]
MTASSRTPSQHFDEPTLRARQLASQRGFFAAMAGGAPDSRLFELDGCQATLVPVRPWFSIFNPVVYRDGGALLAALPRLAADYEAAGVNAWTVWVPPGDEETARGLEAAGHRLDSQPMLMAAAIDEIDVEPRIELDLHESPTWELIARCNDRAYGVLEPWSMAAVFSAMDDPATRLYAARREGEVAAGLLARELDGDCYFWFVATVPEAQRSGLAAELMRHALRKASEHGCETATLEATKAGEPVYARLGFGSFGRYGMWERRQGA